jgi:hypothetical protein
VFSGMIGVTLFGIFLTPVFFYVIVSLTSRGAPTPEAAGKALVVKDETAGAHGGNGPGTTDGASQGITAQPPPPHAPT